MSTKQIVTIIVIAIVAILGISCISMKISLNNKEIALRQEATAQLGKIEGTHDKMWKIISQKAQVTDKYAKDFDSIYTHIMSNRYSSDDGSLMKWIQEANPQFDVSVYTSLSQSIEALRSEFQNYQERMLDIVREHNTMTKTFPGSWFITDKSDIEYTVVSSSKSKMVMETGMDDETNVF